MLRMFALTAAVAAAVVASGSAQSRNWDGDNPCGNNGNRRLVSFCDVREETIGGANPIDVDAGPNGGIRIHGWDRGDVVVRTRIEASARTDAEARQLASAVRVETMGGRVRATGPDTDRDQQWNVSFELQVPRNAMLTLNTQNGGIAIDDFRGSAQFRARNGGLSLSNIGGDLRGETTNGGVTIDLSGDRWDGTGLDVRTTNGGIRMNVPKFYSAELETGTTNGGFNIDFPVTVQGSFDRHFTTTLGSGGARLRVVTTNGGVTIRQR